MSLKNYIFSICLFAILFAISLLYSYHVRIIPPDIKIANVLQSKAMIRKILFFTKSGIYVTKSVDHDQNRNSVHRNGKNQVTREYKML